MTGQLHRYRTELAWAGTTAVGYDRYRRDHEVRTPTVDVGLHLSGDVAFRGDPSRWNPEQLLVAAASSCQLLSFLAVCARARIDVVAYADVALGVMPTDDLPLRLTRIELHPVVTLADADADRERPSPERLAHLTEVAHRECFIANSLRTEVVVTPTFTWSG